MITAYMVLESIRLANWTEEDHYELQDVLYRSHIRIQSEEVGIRRMRQILQKDENILYLFNAYLEESNSLVNGESVDLSLDQRWINYGETGQPIGINQEKLESTR